MLAIACGFLVIIVVVVVVVIIIIIIIITIIIILAHHHKAKPVGRRYCSESKVTRATFIRWWKCCGRRPHSPLQSHWQALEQEACLPWIISDGCDSLILRPNSCVSSTARWFHVAAVSIATGMKTWLLASCLYLASLVLVALSTYPKIRDLEWPFYVKFSLLRTALFTYLL